MKNEIINQISNELWENVTENKDGMYSVKDAKELVRKMKRTNYPMIEIPEEFAYYYNNDYMDYAVYSINREVKQVKTLPDFFINRNCDFLYKYFIKLINSNEENYEVIQKRLEEMQEKSSEVEIMESGLSWYTKDKNKRNAERIKE